MSHRQPHTWRVILPNGHWREFWSERNAERARRKMATKLGVSPDEIKIEKLRYA